MRCSRSAESRLAVGEIQLRWLRPERLSAAEGAALRALLAPAERERAAAVRAPARRAELELGPALLRLALAAATGEAPAGCALERGRHGWRTRPPLCVGLSHTEGLIAAAVGRVTRLGIDVEAAPRLRSPLALAGRFFAPAEAAALAALPQHERRTRFLELWTLKEAAAKAAGIPLGEALRDVTRADGALRAPGGSAANGLALVQRRIAGHPLAVVADAAGAPLELAIAEGLPGLTNLARLSRAEG